MRIARVQDRQGRTVLAAEREGTLRVLRGDPLLGDVEVSAEVVEPARWLAPVAMPALVCIGLNYRKHAEESNQPLPKEPVVFMKNPAAACGHEEPIQIPAVCEDEVDYECELAVVIGRRCRNVSPERALEHVLGYAPANDVSARIWQSQRGGSQWVRGKSFDTFAPIGPFLVTADEVPLQKGLDIKTVHNGEIVQSSNTSDMIFDVATIISFLSQGTTLLPGTTILTGTPAGVGWARNPKRLLHAGDRVSVQIEGLGELSNPVVDESGRGS